MEAAIANPVLIPDWKDLCGELYSPDHDHEFTRTIASLRDQNSSPVYRIARQFVSHFLPGMCYQKFLNFRWSEIVELIADQAVRNRTILANTTEASQQSMIPVTGKFDARVFRPHSQLPCTQGTAAQRVQKALEMFSHDAKILLLGDDDMVSVELAMAGFRNVTAVDIDRKVLRSIDRICDANGLKIRSAIHDLRQPAPQHLIDNYDLVFFDPEYSQAGLEMFVSSALNFTNGRPGTCFFVSIHLMSLMPSGITTAESFLNSIGVELLEFHQGFNVYPVPTRLRGLIRLVNQVLIGSKALGVDGYTFPYFLSDAMLLRKY